MERFFYRLFRFEYGIEAWVSRRFTTGGFMVLLCLMLTAATGGDTNNSLTYQIVAFLLVVLVLAIALSYFTRIRLRRRFKVVRHLPRFGVAGTPLQYRIAVQQTSGKTQTGLRLFEEFADPRPSFSEALEALKWSNRRARRLQDAFGYSLWRSLIQHKRGAIAKSVHLPPLPDNRTVDVEAQLLPLHRGVIHLRGLTIACPDPFGLFNACVSVTAPHSLLVLPKLYPIPPIQLPGLRRHQSGGISLASSVGDSEEFRSLRDYRPGDSLRKIHWKSWAKVAKPIVKEEQDEFFVRHALILDTFQPQRYSDVLEEAVSVAASFACEVQTQESLLDLLFVGNEAYCFTVGRGLGHTNKMLEILASVIPCQDKSFETLIPVVMNQLSVLSGCICVLLTWDEARQTLVQKLRAMQIPTLVLIVVGGKLGNRTGRMTTAGTAQAEATTGVPMQDMAAKERLEQELLTGGWLGDDLAQIRVLQVGDMEAGLMSL